MTEQSSNTGPTADYATPRHCQTTRCIANHGHPNGHVLADNHFDGTPTAPVSPTHTTTTEDQP